MRLGVPTAPGAGFGWKTRWTEQGPVGPLAVKGRRASDGGCVTRRQRSEPLGFCFYRESVMKFRVLPLLVVAVAVALFIGAPILANEEAAANKGAQHEG